MELQRKISRKECAIFKFNNNNIIDISSFYKVIFGEEPSHPKILV
jgi:hypothetical protein